jgi:hypothetical protein
MTLWKLLRVHGMFGCWVLGLGLLGLFCPHGSDEVAAASKAAKSCVVVSSGQLATADEIEATEVEQAQVVEFDEDDACVTVVTKLPTTMDQVDEDEDVEEKQEEGTQESEDVEAVEEQWRDEEDEEDEADEEFEQHEHEGASYSRPVTHGRTPSVRDDGGFSAPNPHHLKQSTTSALSKSADVPFSLGRGSNRLEKSSNGRGSSVSSRPDQDQPDVELGVVDFVGGYGNSKKKKRGYDKVIEEYGIGVPKGSQKPGAHGKKLKRQHDDEGDGTVVSLRDVAPFRSQNRGRVGAPTFQPKHRR